jgi:threonine/homoserine/homoserine lactone efflux protein
VDSGFLLRGLAIGFAIALPVGPIGVLCIRRTLAEGRAAGLISGLGAASADAIYGCVAAFGLTAVSTFLLNHQFWLRLVGGLFLCCLGVKTFLSKPATSSADVKGGSLATDYASTLFLTLTNPMTILSFAAVFAGVGLGSAAADYVSALKLVTGVFLGSALWWLLLSFGINLSRAKFNESKLRWVNRLSGIAICGFGLIALCSLRK